MPYFDLHCHPGLKTLFKPQDGMQFSAWHTISAPALFGDILSSQSSLEQLTRNQEIPLLCMTLHPPESGMINQFIIKIGADTIFHPFMDPARLQQMYSGADGYQEVFAEELANLLAAPRLDDNIPATTQVKFLQDWSDYDPTATGTLHVVFNIEGGHALYGNGDDPGTAQQAMDNLQTFLDKGYLVLYLTPTHLTPNQFINHAYGNKILTKGPLLPRSLGISPDGKALIDFAYGKGLLIDVKHMSLVSRLMFYHIHQQFYPGKPILASHAGLTGRSIDESTLLLGWSTSQQATQGVMQLNGTQTPGLLPGTAFYPLSINLFIEDIVPILQSGGMIGLSMDLRILGGKSDTMQLQNDFLSNGEYQVLNQPAASRDQQIRDMADALWAGTLVPPPAPTLPPTPDPPEFGAAVDEEAAELTASGTGGDTGPNAALHARLLANHLLHLRAISDNWGPVIAPGWTTAQVWDHVCIGSDFDGLIEAVDCCKHVTALSTMAALLEQELDNDAVQMGVDLGLPAAQIVAKFCYTNAFDFFNRHFGV